MNNELKACPFCGSDDIRMYEEASLEVFFVTCEDCDCEGPADRKRDEAERRWNRRME